MPNILVANFANDLKEIPQEVNLALNALNFKDANLVPVSKALKEDPKDGRRTGAGVFEPRKTINFNGDETQESAKSRTLPSRFVEYAKAKGCSNLVLVLPPEKKAWFTPNDLKYLQGQGISVSIVVNGNIEELDDNYRQYLVFMMSQASEVFFTDDEFRKRLVSDTEQNLELNNEMLFEGNSAFKVKKASQNAEQILVDLKEKSYHKEGDQFVKNTPENIARKILANARAIQNKAVISYQSQTSLDEVSKIALLNPSANDWFSFPGNYFGVMEDCSCNSKVYERLAENANYVENYRMLLETYFKYSGLDISTGAENGYLSVSEKPDEEVGIESGTEVEKVEYNPTYDKFSSVLESFIGMTDGNRRAIFINDSKKTQQNAAFLNILKCAELIKYSPDNDYDKILYKELEEICRSIKEIGKGNAALIQIDYSAKKAEALSAKKTEVEQRIAAEEANRQRVANEGVDGGIEGVKRAANRVAAEAAKLRAGDEERRRALNEERQRKMKEERRVAAAAEEQRRVKEEEQRRAEAEAAEKQRAEAEAAEKQRAEAEAAEQQRAAEAVAAAEREAREREAAEQQRAREAEQQRVAAAAAAAAAEEQQRLENEAAAAAAAEEKRGLTLLKATATTTATEEIDQIKADIAKAVTSQAEAQECAVNANHIAGEGEDEANQFETESDESLAQAAKAKAAEARTVANEVEKNAADAKENAEKAMVLEDNFPIYLAEIEAATKTDEVEQILTKITSDVKVPVEGFAAAAKKNADDANANLARVVVLRAEVAALISEGKAKLDQAKSEEKERKAQEEEEARKREEEARNEQERKAQEEADRQREEEAQKAAQAKAQADAQALIDLKDQALAIGRESQSEIEKAKTAKNLAEKEHNKAQDFATTAEQVADDFQNARGVEIAATAKRNAAEVTRLAAEVRKNASEAKINSDKAEAFEVDLNLALAEVSAALDTSALQAASLKIDNIKRGVKIAALAATEDLAKALKNCLLVAAAAQKVIAEVNKPLAEVNKPKPAPEEKTPSEISYVEDKFVAIRTTPGTKKTPGTVIKLSFAVAAKSVDAQIAAKVTEGQYRVIGEVYKNPETKKIVPEEVTNTIVGIIATVSNELNIDQTKFFAEIEAIRSEGGAANKQVTTKGTEKIYAERDDADVSISNEMRRFSTLFQKYAFQCGIYDGSKMGDVVKEMVGFRLCNIDDEILKTVTNKKDEIFVGGTDLEAMQLHLNQVDKSMQETAKIIPAEILNQANDPKGQGISRENLTTIVR